MAMAAAIGGGALLGGLAANNGRDKQKNLTETSSYSPWQASWLSYGFDQAKQQYNTPRQFFPDQTYAGPSSSTINGLNALENRATNGNPMVNAAQNQNLSTINGDYLNSNPYLQQAIDNASQGVTRNFNQTVMPGIQSEFSGAGRYGSGAQVGAEGQARYDLANNLGQVASNMSYGNYSDERNRQSQAVANAPAFAASDYNDIQNLLTAGSQREAISQQGIDEAMNRFQFAQDEPRNRLAEYLGLIGGNYGGTTTTTARNPNYKSSGAAFLGGALSGAGAGLSMMNSYKQSQKPPTQ